MTSWKKRRLTPVTAPVWTTFDDLTGSIGLMLIGTIFIVGLIFSTLHYLITSF